MSWLSVALALQITTGALAISPDSVRSPFVHPWAAMLQAETSALPPGSLQWGALPVRLRSTWNGKLPREAHDSELWSGRGMATSLRGGVGLRWGPVELTLAPEVARIENRPFDRLPGADPGRSPFASPFYGSGIHSLDMPLRPGTESITRWSLGWSTLRAVVPMPWLAGSVQAGVSSSPMAWGPSWRNGLLLSVHGPGIPRMFVEGEHRGRWGSAHWQIFSGVLTESLFFDRDSGNDQRGLGGVAVAVSPRWIPGVQLGLGRMAMIPSGTKLTLDELLGAPFRGASYAAELQPDGTLRQPEADALTMLFTRWVHHEQGVSVGAEIAWQEPPTGLRDLMTRIAHTRAYTLSAQWAPPPSQPKAGHYARVEVTSLDLDPVRSDRPPLADFYSGRAAIQGFTQRGRLLGAVVGPGGQSLWIEAGMPAPWGLTVGGHAGWSRFNNDAFAREPRRNFTRRESALEGGVRLALKWRDQYLVVDGGAQRRINYLLQNGFANPLGIRTVTLTNPFVSVSLDWRP